MAGLPLAFTHPLLLAALALLPVIWWLLRLTPPAPRRQRFPPTFLLRRLESRARTPVHTPWWLLLLRCLIAALLIVALAGPVWNPQPLLGDRAGVLVVLDDGFETGRDFDVRRRTLLALAEQARAEGRALTVAATAPGRSGVRILAGPPAEVLAAARELAPQPWPADRAALARALADRRLGEVEVHWIASPWATDAADEAGALELARVLAAKGSLSVYLPGDAEPPLLLRALPEEGADLALAVERPRPGPARAVGLVAYGPGGEGIARSEARFPEGAASARAAFTLPLEVHNRLARVEIEGERTAAAVWLFDERWKRRVVGLWGGGPDAEAQPLLSELHYLQRALEPWAEVRRAPPDELVADPLSLLVLADVGRLDETTAARLRAWVEAGGVLLRFAGPRLAASGDADGLVPVPLRRGERVLGTAFSTEGPLRFAPFPAEGPFAGLAPDPEVRVYRQLLARPSPDLPQLTLATLEDGTPAVTGRRLGRGWLLLVHTAADPAWSDLPLSRLFIDLLRRVLALAPGAGSGGSGLFVADRVLDGYGRLQPAPADLLPVRLGEGTPRVGPGLPPGLWRPAGGDAEAPAVAVNLADAVSGLRPLDLAGFGTVRGMVREAQIPLAPWLLSAAFALALLDLLLALALRGLLGRTRPAATAVLPLALVFAAAPLRAQEPADEALVRLAAETRLAYVITGIPEVDRASEAGLRGLSLVLALRTSVEPGDPVGVDPARDELALFPLLYWPVPPEHPPLGPGTLQRVQAYLDHGGTILFDTGDGGRILPGAGPGPGEMRLQELFAGLDLPPMEPLPPDHALTRAFYLLREFPGRYAGFGLWVSRPEPGVNDGVSAVIVGYHDWAGAWAVDSLGEPLHPVVPGGERQRELARRFGVNLAMYALTGNYKTDQVHVPAILERLGQ
ncbi:hypothetical protein HRbin39_00731 [bacterium HR39]|nr:hypothetical protein HRbin39_00731 [bacterium HR39]